MINWITEYIGTASWDEVAKSQILSDVSILDVRDLVDKQGNTKDLVSSKIEEGLKYLNQGKRVVICCDYGVSRSNAVAVGIISKYENIGFQEALNRVVEKTGQSQIRLEVLSVVREVLGCRSDISTEEKARRRILITGSSGFIGSSLLKFINSDWFIVAPSRKDIDLTKEYLKLEMLVREKGIDTILHLANPRIYGTNESLAVTLLMLKNVLDVCIQNNLRLIYLSSWEIFSGYKSSELIADEALPPRPGGTYGQTKFLAEKLIEHYHSQYGLRFVILRSSPVYGPTGERPKFIWNFLDKAMRNQDIVAHKYLNGFPKLDLLYIDDLCKAIVSAVEHDVEGFFNIGTGIGTSTTDVAYYIIQIVSSKSIVKHIQIEAYASNVIMDYRRAQVSLNWNPSINVYQGLEKLISLSYGDKNKD
ncbi:MAG: NAD-dependent epimerase/dehydratase family protein [Candidatus Calescibacterium sp.]|nr:NAD-dependent epimerase/dehydratase family protein [Candidatus Calescibacterium sp.]MDW8087806.1 NAD-dependent epimerase/dehydratase family protein [Candidatus Calescibacterium sp.]